MFDVMTTCCNGSRPAVQDVVERAELHPLIQHLSRQRALAAFAQLGYILHLVRNYVMRCVSQECCKEHTVLVQTIMFHFV